MYTHAFEAILKDHSTPAAVRAIELGGSTATLKATITDSGFLELLADEASGGAGATLRELYPLVALCGFHAVPLPLVQTMAARLLVPEQGALPGGMLTFASAPLQKAGSTIVCALVPFAMVADHVITLGDDGPRLLSVARADRTPTGVHGSLAASLRWEAGAGERLRSAAGEGLQALGAVLHAGLLAGAMKRVFDMSLQYGNDRVQFGKSIGKFQAIQHQLSVMAEHVAAASIAAEAAFQCDRRAPSLLASAVAKSRTSEAAQIVASIAHAVHGAIGITEEYDLQLYTRRLHEWRMAHGSEAHWNRVLGQSLLDNPQDLIADFVRGITA